MDKKWWEKESLQFSDQYNPSARWALARLMQDTMSAHAPVYDIRISGELVEPKPFYPAHMAAFKELGFWLGYESEHDSVQKSWILFHDAGIVELSQGGNHASIQMALKSLELVDKLKARFSKGLFRDHEPQGTVYAMTKNSRGYTFTAVGEAGTKFIPENYNEDVAATFSKIRANLVSKEPNGRLYILNGIPGTGKTYFIRGLLQETEDVNFVVIPASLMQSLTDPEFMSALISELGENPTCLILEDADQCLVNRQHGDMPSISSLLNLSDGIIGSLLSIHIICTTNAEQVDIDPAAMRAGRLGAHMDFRQLPVEQANRVLQKFNPDLKPFDQDVVLAEIYQRVKESR